jgi:hypothetical protein
MAFVIKSIIEDAFDRSGLTFDRESFAATQAFVASLDKPGYVPSAPLPSALAAQDVHEVVDVYFPVVIHKSGALVSFGSFGAAFSAEYRYGLKELSFVQREAA